MTRSHKKPSLLAITGCLASAAAAFGQIQPGNEPAGKAPVSTAGTGKPQAISAQAGDPGRAGGMGTVEPNIVKDAEAVYDELFRTAATGYNKAFVLGGNDGRVQVASPTRFSFHNPLAQWTFRPEDAELKVGNFYLDFRTLSGSLLFTDNANRTEVNKKEGVIGVMTLQMAAMLQVEERFRLAVGGSLTYLPFKNKIGFADPFQLFSAGLTPQALAHISYNFPVAGWDIEAFDHLSVHTPGYLRGEAFDMFDTDMEALDRLGRYSYRIPYDPDGRDYLSDRIFDTWIFRNRAGLSASRLIPTDTRITFGGYHENLWTRGFSYDIPDYFDVVYARAESERENLRFKPFFDYRATHADNRDGWDHVTYGGVKGPVTDYIDFLGEAGYLWADDPSHETVLWTLRLNHQINPRTYHFAQFQRNVTYPVRTVRTGVSYQFRHQFNDDLAGEIGADYWTYDVLDRGTSKTDEVRAGARLTYAMTPRLNARVGGYYRWIDIPTDTMEIWTGRLELDMKLTEKMNARLMYQYESRAEDRDIYEYAENLIILSIIRRF